MTSKIKNKISEIIKNASNPIPEILYNLNNENHRLIYSRYNHYNENSITTFDKKANIYSGLWSAKQVKKYWWHLRRIKWTGKQN